MGLFSFLSKKTEKEKLQEQYEALLKESFDLSKVDRKKSDQKMAEAEAIASQIEKLE